MKTNKKILVVDDMEETRRSISLFLELAGYQTVVAVNGEDALEKLSGQEINLILMHVIMPGMNGLTTAREIKSRKPAQPLIFMSGYEKDSFSPGLFPEGSSSFLTKPISGEDLLNEIEKQMQVA